MKREDIIFSEDKKENEWICRCVFNEFGTGYERFLEHLDAAESTDDFIKRVIDDDALMATQGYAEICKTDRDLVIYAFARQIGRASETFVTSSDAGSVRISKGGFSVLVPNGYGDGDTTVCVFNHKDKELLNQNLFSYWTIVDGAFVVCDSDVGPAVPAISLRGRFNVFYARGVVVFLELDEPADAADLDIVELINAAGLNQSSFARRFDIPLRTVQDWCAGRRQPPEYIVKMAEEILL